MPARSLVAALLLLVAAACSATGDLEVDRAELIDEAAAPGVEAPDAAAPDTAAPDTAAPDPDAPAVEDSPEPADPEPTVPSFPDTDEVGPTERGVAASDRIVVAAGNGRVYLIDPDGEERLDLSQSGQQPVWSPDGRRIAWSQRDASGFSIMSTNVDRTEPRRARTLFSGYFGYWSPTSDSLGFLGNAPPGTGLVLDAGTGSDLDSTIDSDTFYYFSWSPDGTRWVVHSGSGFSIVSLDGTRSPLALEPASFRAPTWADDGSLLLAVRIGERNVIASVDPDTGTFDELVQVGDVTNFVLDPTGRYLAVESITFEEGQDSAGDGITVSTSSQPSRPGAEVLIYDRQTGVLRQILNEPTGGFWWSPDGSTLLMMVQEEGPTAELAQWLVWRADGSFRTDRFTPTPAFAAAYVPFFDQFAQSVTPWSPDSQQFVYSAFDEQGDPGVFVQPARPNTPPQRISDDAGVAFWSPT